MLDHFDIIAPLYEKIGKSGYPHTLARCLKMPGKGWLLDAGGGTGRLSVHFKAMGINIVVLDTSLGMLRHGPVKEGLCPVNASVENLPFSDGTFDRIVVADAFHHFKHQGSAIGELSRVLKPGGRLVIEEPDIGSNVIRIVALLEKLFRMQSRFISPAGIVRLLRKEGLGTKIKEWGRLRAWITADKPLARFP